MILNHRLPAPKKVFLPENPWHGIKMQFAKFLPAFKAVKK